MNILNSKPNYITEAFIYFPLETTINLIDMISKSCSKTGKYVLYNNSYKILL